MFLLFGEYVYQLYDVAAQESEFANAFDFAQEYLARRGRLGDMYWLYNDRKFDDACKICHGFVDRAVARALEASAAKRSQAGEDGRGYVFIEALVQQPQDPIVLRDQCLNVLLAGRDTTGCCLTWTL